MGIRCQGSSETTVTETTPRCRWCPMLLAHRVDRRRRVDGMVAGTGEPSTKRAKVGEPQLLSLMRRVAEVLDFEDSETAEEKLEAAAVRRRAVW